MSLRTEDDTKACEDALYAVVAAELNNWVPGPASVSSGAQRTA